MKRNHLRSVLLKVAIAVTLLVGVLAATGVGPFSGALTSSDEAVESSESSEETTDPEGGGQGEDGTADQAAPADVSPPSGALLAVNDLPAGWSVEVKGPQESHDSICGTKFDLTSGGAATPKVFFSRVPDGDYLAQTIVAFTDGGAAASLDRLRSLVDGCGEWATEQSDGSTQTWELEQAQLPQIGDDMVAFRLFATVGDLALETTQVVIRRGDVLNTIAYIAGAGTRERIQPIAELADEKLRETS